MDPISPLVKCVVRLHADRLRSLDKGLEKVPNIVYEVNHSAPSEIICSIKVGRYYFVNDKLPEDLVTLLTE